MTIVVQLLYFLEHTDPELLDRASAEQMEGEIAYQLSRVHPQALGSFVAFIRQQAQTSAWPAEREFLQGLPSLLGWSDD